MLEVRLNKARSDQDSQQQYEHVYSEVGQIAQNDSFYQWVFQLLQLQPDDLYLDVSCGQAELPKLAQTNNLKGHGIDLSHNALIIGRQVFETHNLVTANSQQLPYKNNCFDVVSNIGSLEHYVDMKTAVQEMTRVLAPHGRAVVLVPNTFSLLNNIWIAYRQGRTSIDPYQPIQRYGARLEWQELLESNGLMVEKTIKYDRVKPKTKSEWYKILRHPKDLLRLLAAPIIPLNLAFCFVFICKKQDVETS